MARQERFVNNAVTSLNGAITDVATSLTVDDTSMFPTDGDFRLLIEQELLLVMAVSGSVFTVVRGIESTAGAAHVSGAAVKAILTKDALLQRVKDFSDPLAGIRSPYRLVNSTQATIDNTDFTEVNLGTATYSTDANGNIVCEHPQTVANDIRVLLRSAPTPPYTIRAAMIQSTITNAVNGPFVGLGFRENSTGELSFICNRVDETSNINGFNFDSPTVLNGTFGTAVEWQQARSGIIWFEIEDNNTDLKFRLSKNGIDFIEYATFGRTTFMAGGPDEICWIVDGKTGGTSSPDFFAKLFSWSGE